VTNLFGSRRYCTISHDVRLHHIQWWWVMISIKPIWSRFSSRKIYELLKYSIIILSFSPYASPILLVEKKNGSNRLCVDFRELNSNTVADKYSLLLLQDQINRLRGAYYFTCLDMASGYYQIPLNTNSIEYRVFVTPDGQYNFLSIPLWESSQNGNLICAIALIW